jgi:hypothetical protein
VPKLKLGDDDLDIDALEEAEYNEDDYQEYTGKQPPAGTVLAGYVKKMWWAYTNNGDGMLVALFIADGNVDEEEKYNGLPVWDRMALITSAKFRWKPFLDAMGFTLRDVKSRTRVAEDDDNIGAPIQRIGSWEPGEEALARIITKRDRFNDEPSTKVKTWLAYEDPEEDADEDEEEEYEEEDADEDEDDVQGRRTGRVAHPTRVARPAPKATRASQRTAKPATRATPATGRRATVGRRGASKSRGYDEDPPF